MRVPTEVVYIRKANREKLKRAEERTGKTLARLLNLFVEDGHLEEVEAKHSKGFYFQRIKINGFILVDPQTSKNLGGVGALLLFIGPLLSYALFFAGLIPLIGFILVLIALKGFADHYKDAGIFNNALYGFITAIVGVVAGLGALIVTAFGIYAKEGITDWIKLAKWTAALTVRRAFIYYGRVILAFIVIFIFAMLTARFYRKSLSLLASKSRVGLFSTAGLLLLIGAVLTIIVLGLLLIWISFLIIAIAFFSIKTTVAEPTPPSPPS